MALEGVAVGLGIGAVIGVAMLAPPVALGAVGGALVAAGWAKLRGRPVTEKVVMAGVQAGGLVGVGLCALVFMLPAGAVFAPAATAVLGGFGGTVGTVSAVVNAELTGAEDPEWQRAAAAEEAEEAAERARKEAERARKEAERARKMAKRARERRQQEGRTLQPAQERLGPVRAAPEPAPTTPARRGMLAALGE